jgi:hypothetical protein
MDMNMALVRLKNEKRGRPEERRRKQAVNWMPVSGPQPTVVCVCLPICVCVCVYMCVHKPGAAKRSLMPRNHLLLHRHTGREGGSTARPIPALSLVC